MLRRRHTPDDLPDNWPATGNGGPLFFGGAMFVQKRNDHWLLIEWVGRPLRPVILSQHDTQQQALDAMKGQRLLPLPEGETLGPSIRLIETITRRWGNDLPDVPLAHRGFGT